MKLQAVLKMLLFTALAGIIAACSHQSVPLHSIYSSNDCAIDVTTIQSINSADELERLLTSFPPDFSQKPRIREPIDYHRQTLILYALGQKTSSGYAIIMEKNAATLSGGRLYLPLVIRQPESNSFQAQVMTSPCRIFAIPKTDFKQILLAKD